jgi:hypothetical protein
MPLLDFSSAFGRPLGETQETKRRVESFHLMRLDQLVGTILAQFYNRQMRRGESLIRLRSDQGSSGLPSSLAGTGGT